MRDLNFFTSYIGKEKETKTNFICQVILPCLGVLFVVCTFGFNKIYAYSLNKAIGNCNSEISSRQEQIDKVEIQKKKYDILNKYYGEAEKIEDSLKGKNKINYKYIEEIKSKIPKEVSFGSLIINKDAIEITGVGRSRTSIGELQYNLRALQYVNDVQLINVSEERSNGNYEFSIKCALKDDDKNEGK